MFLLNVHSLQNMCMLESELENQLGEFHVKMKGTFMSVFLYSSSVVTPDPSVPSLPVGLSQSNGCIVRLFVCLYVVMKGFCLWQV